MNNPEIVPEKLSNPLNPIVIIAILVAGSAIFAIMQFLPEEDGGMLAFSLSIVFSGGVAVTAFIVSKQNETGILRKAYLFLGFGFTSYVIAELLYYSFELFLDIEPYPSVADIFFFALYPLTLGHLLFNIQFFHSGYTKLQKIWVPAIPIFAIIVYVVISLGVPDAEMNFDFYYGLIFVSAAAATLSFTVVGASIFKQGTLGAVWLLLALGLMFNAAGDIWYYHLEIFGEYFDAHPVTIVWYVANMFIIYALIKHLKTI